MSSNDYDKKMVSKALDKVLKRTREDGPKHAFELSEGRYIFISDIHKGDRDCADDFRASEQTYNAMLAYYFSLGHTLVILGDAEELWENRPKPVMKEYRHSFDLEKKFFHEDRYIRIWGNHDIIWSKKSNLRKFLCKALGASADDNAAEKTLHVSEAHLIEIVDNDEKLGEIFLVHGHQGSKRSDRYWKWSRLAVSIFARPIQCVFGHSWNPKTPSHDSALRKNNNKALYDWSEEQDSLLLIAGHTHRPVFASESHRAKIERKIKELDPLENGFREKKAELEAEREWAITQEMQMPDDMLEKPMEKKCYFNTGCCCFSDGNTTGIEICDSKIRLVHWPNRADQPKPHILQEESLMNMMGEISSFRRGSE